MNYKVGDTVVCIDAKSIPGCGPIKSIALGRQYTVNGFHACDCVSLKEVGGRCSECNLEGHQHYRPWRFIKLDGLETETGTEVAIRNQQVIPEVL